MIASISLVTSALVFTFAPAGAPTTAEAGVVTVSPEPLVSAGEAAVAPVISPDSQPIAPVELNAPPALAVAAPSAAPGVIVEPIVSGAQSPGTLGMASEASSVPVAQLEMAATRVVEEEVIPHDIKWRLDLGVGGGSYAALDESYGVFTGEMTSVGRLDIDVGLSFPIGDSGLYLGGRVGYRMFESGFYDVHGLFPANYRQQEISFGARLGVAVLDGVEPYVDMAGGPTLWRSARDEEVDLVSTGVDELGGMSTLVPIALADRTLGFVKGTAGVQLYIPRHWLPRKEGSRVTAGIDVNVGYVWRPSFEVTVVEREPVEGAIETSLPTFGSVNASGVTWSAGLFLRVM